MNNFKDRAKIYHQRIREALLNEWDPIGVSEIPEASSEYDGYVGDIYRLLIQRASEHEIFNFLWWVEVEHMGLCGNRQRTEKFAIRLIRIIEEVEGHTSNSTT